MNDSYEKNWLKLDNAAQIYPASRSRNWTALFRVSSLLTEQVDPLILKEALLCTLPRFPAFRMRLRNGLFWCYMEDIREAAVPQPDVANPCVRMDLRENNGYMFRVRYHDKRIAVEIFHALTDGTGGLCFLKTLTAEYLRLKYGALIPRSSEILDCTQPPEPSELEDSFVKYARTASFSRDERPAYCIHGTPTAHYMHIISGIIPLSALKAKAKEYSVSVGEFITSVLICSIAEIQAREPSRRQRNMPVKINVPVNLRSYYPSKTLRNFSSYVNPGIEPGYGSFTFEEVLREVSHFMRLELSEKRMNARFTTNVKAGRNLAVRLAPLPLKQAILKGAFVMVGDRYSSSTVSNLGVTTLPEEMAKYVTRLDFMLGPLFRNPVTCACLSYNGQTVIHFTRTIAESQVERGFFTRLVKMGIPVHIESNDAASEN